MLRYTGHPIADIGVATITAFCQRSRPEDLSVEDLERTAEYLLTQYTSGMLTPYLSCIFTMNASYTQPSWNQEISGQIEEEHLVVHQEDPVKALLPFQPFFLPSKPLDGFHGSSYRWP